MIIEPFIIAAIALGGLGIGFYQNYRKKRVFREVRREERTPLADFDHRQVGKVVGFVAEHKHLLKAPLSGRECVYYHILVQEKSGNNDNWTTIIDDGQYVDFLVQSGGRTAWVQRGYLEGHLFKDVRLKSGFMKSLPHQVEKYLRSKGHSSRTFLGFKRTLRFYEGILHPGEQVAVRGRGHWEMLPDPSEQRLIFKGEPGLEVQVTDDPAAF